MRAQPWFVVLAAVLSLPLAGAYAQPDGEEASIRLGDVIAAAQFNHAAADERYVGKRLRIVGRAVSIERVRTKDGPLEYQVNLESDSGPSQPNASLRFVFPEKARSGLADIQRGSMVIIEALCQDDQAQGSPKLSFRDSKLIRIFEPASTAPAVAPTPGVPSISPYGPPTAPDVGPMAPRTFFIPARP